MSDQPRCYGGTHEYCDDGACEDAAIFKEVESVCRPLREEIRQLRAELEQLRESVAYAHGRLESEAACPTPKQMPDSLRMLADERAGWIEVAIEHNKQCAQLQGHPVVTTEVEHLRAELEQAQRVQCDCDFENMEQSQTCPIHGELAVRLTEARKDTARIDWIDRNMDCDLAGDGLHVSLVDIGDTQTIREAIDEAIALAATPEPQEEQG